MHICGSIETTGNTIAVLPSGLKNIYPKENIDLYNKILENNGLIVTEYEDNEEGTSERFLERNRIVSGLAIGTLVIEGGYRSGTSITANLTKREGKKVFCIPSNLDSNKGITPNRLIKEGGFLVTRVEDIISEYPEINFIEKNIKKTRKKINIDNFISKEYENIYKVLDEEKLIHVNEISKKLNIPTKEVNYKLMMLELEGRIVSFPGNNYKRK